MIKHIDFNVFRKMMWDRNLDLKAKAIYSYLYNAIGRNIEDLTKEEICHDLNITDDIVNKCLNQLSDFGYIIMEKDERKNEHEDI